MRRRVVITGMGTVTPHADDVGELFRQVSEGISAVDRIVQFDPGGLPTQMAAEVRYEVRGPEFIGPYDARPRPMRFVTTAAQHALDAAGLQAVDEDDWAARSRRAVHLSIGVGSTALEAVGPLALATWGGPDADSERELAPLRQAIAGDLAVSKQLEDYFLDHAAPALAVMLGAGRISTAASACASGSHALLDAVHMIRRGESDIVLGGGVCTPVTRSMVPGFAMLSALSSRNDDPQGASRPFDGGRDGFIMAEGASVMVIEDLEHALARGAKIEAEILGVGIATDAYRLTDPEPGGRGMGAAMQMAVADAGLSTADVDYINAHGTSTKLNDLAETIAIKNVFGQRAYDVPVSSSKSMFGHLIHAAGTTEAMICVGTLNSGVITPTINHEDPDPDCDLDYVPNVAREGDVKVALSNSFGFGGQNVSLALGRWTGR